MSGKQRRKKEYIEAKKLFSDFLIWLKTLNPDTTLVDWWKRKRARDKEIREIEAKCRSEEYKQKVAEQAYLLWEADGKPEGKDDHYWKLAIDIVEGKNVPTIYRPYYLLEKRILEPSDAWISKQAFFTILGRLGNLALIVAVVSFILGEKIRRNNEVFTAWQTITSAHKQSGSGGRIQALEFLNSRPWRFPWIGRTDKDWFWDERSQECKEKRLWGLRWEREPLTGLSAPNSAYLRNIHLCGANLWSANLQGAYLEDAYLQGAYLRSANLQGADLEDAYLQGAYLGSADLQGAYLRAANLQKANLWSAILQKAYLGSAYLQGAYLEDAILQGAYLEDANLQKADLEDANLQKADLEDANLQGAYLRYANLQGADLEDAYLQKANLRSADLQGAYLRAANLQKAYLGYAYLQGAYLEDANLQGANLWSANLQKADLWSANLQKADLRAANLQKAYLEDANLQKAYLEDARNLTSQQIKSTCFWDKAIYKGEYYKNEPEDEPYWVAIEPDNTNYIEELKQDTTSDPKQPPNCSRWQS